MVRPICKDIIILSQKSKVADKHDMNVANDLLDTLMAHAFECVGMAANMIGVCKNIIAFEDGGAYELMFNPVIISKSGEYETHEGCLSLSGERKTFRYEKITVKFRDRNFRSRTKEYTGAVAQRIQHECDHLEGIII
ncbi:MAG: peptide deformylase [Lachnospiraceae bacterium]|nr:peptide deformylase [Lachnospiraceae bacterium]